VEFLKVQLERALRRELILRVMAEPFEDGALGVIFHDILTVRGDDASGEELQRWLVRVLQSSSVDELLAG
jgi:hypothetical protein